MTINVTQKHIDEGQRSVGSSGRCKKCPIALALTDAGLSDPRVGPYMISVGELGLRVRLPHVAASFVMDADSGYVLAPFTFDLPIDPPTKAA